MYRVSLFIFPPRQANQTGKIKSFDNKQQQQQQTVIR